MTRLTGSSQSLLFGMRTVGFSLGANVGETVGAKVGGPEMVGALDAIKTVVLP